MIRVDAAWFAVEPLDMRAGTESALARVVAVFGAARPHTAVSSWRSHVAHAPSAWREMSESFAFKPLDSTTMDNRVRELLDE